MMAIGYRTSNATPSSGNNNTPAGRRMLNSLKTSFHTLQIKHNNRNTTSNDDDNLSCSNSTETTASNNSSQHPTIIQRLRGNTIKIDEEEEVKYVKVLFPTTEEVYEGPMVQGIRHGDGGICTWPDGMKFLGRFEDDVPTEGTLITAAYTFTGKLVDMKFHGSGVLCSSDGSTYEGEFQIGEYHGCGKYKSTNGSVYTGDFVHGVMEGIGNIIESDGISAYSGVWVRGMRVGEGNETLSNGEIYHGQFHRNKRNGNGCLTTKEGVKIEGTFRAGHVIDGGSLEISYPDGRKYSGEGVSCEPHPHGTGTMRYPEARNATDASVYTGEWMYGNRHGKGLCCYANGDVFEGYWDKDTPVKMDMENMETLDNEGRLDDKEGMTVPTLESSKPTPEVDIYDDRESICSHLTDPTTISATTLDMSSHASNSTAAVHTYPNGDTYHGRVDRRRQRQGYGKYITSSSTYEGEFKNSNKHGRGTYVTPYAKYDGAFHQDQMHGNGTLVFNDSSSYTGGFKDGNYHGKGTLSEEDGIVYKGYFIAGLRHGHGTESIPASNTYYDGEYSKGKRDGVGTLQCELDQSILFTGLWKNGLFDGEGYHFYKNHGTFLKFEGSFQQGQQSGPGMLTLKDESILIGKWIRNSPTDGIWQITYPPTSLCTSYSGAASFYPPQTLPIPHGNGTMNYASGDIYTGNYDKGNRTGRGKCNYQNGDVWDGTWANDELDYNCVGVLTLADGTVERFDGEVGGDAAYRI